MGYSSTTGVLTYPFTKLKASGKGDLENALNLQATSFQTLMTTGTINPMAKYKPLKNSNDTFDSFTARNTARKNARYGFPPGNPPTLSMSSGVPSNVWQYQRPASGDPLRAEDFIKNNTSTSVGYDVNAVAPLIVSVGQLVYNEWSYVTVAVNSGVKSFGGGNWVNDRSLSIEDLLGGGTTDMYNKYVAFIFVDTSSSNTKNLVVTRVTFKQLIDTYSGIHTFKFSDSTHTRTDSGVTYAKVPLFASSRSGHNITVIVCLMTGNSPSSSSTAYNVYSSSLTNYTPYSVGFVSGCDRATTTLTSGAFKMDGTQITSMTITVTNMVTEMEYNSLVYRAYRVTVTGVFSTANVAYSGNKRIMGTLNLSNNSTFPFGPSPGEGNTPITVPVSVELAGSTANQSKTIYTSEADEYLWIAKNGSSMISTTITGAVTFTDPFDTPLTKSATKTAP